MSLFFFHITCNQPQYDPSYSTMTLENGRKRKRKVEKITRRPPVVHQQKLEVLHVVHQELEEATWQHMPGLLVGAVTDVGHQGAALELTADPRVDTLRPPPVRLSQTTTLTHTISARIPKKTPALPDPPTKKNHNEIRTRTP